MRRARIDLQGGPLDDLRREQSRGADRHDLIVVAVQDQRRHVELLEILGEIRLGERLDAVEDGLDVRQHPLQPERVPQSLRDLGARPVGAVERRAQILEELRAVGEHAGAELVERLHRQAAGIGGRLQHQRRHRADQHGLGDTLRAVAADVAGDFAAAGGVADVDRVLQVERFDQRREVVGVGVHVVAVPGLARPAMAAAVMRDAAVAARGQKHHLVFPGVGAQRPAVAEDDGLSRAPVLVVEIDVAGILLTNSNVWHRDSPFRFESI